MSRRYHEGDWVRLRAPVRAHTWRGTARDLPPGAEGLVIIGPDAYPGQQIVEFPVAVLDRDGVVEEFPDYAEADLSDHQLELVARGKA